MNASGHANHDCSVRVRVRVKAILTVAILTTASLYLLWQGRVLVRPGGEMGLSQLGHELLTVTVTPTPTPALTLGLALTLTLP